MDLPEKVAASQNPEVPEGERHDLSTEIYGEFVKDVEIMSPEDILELQEQILGPGLNKSGQLWSPDLNKSVQLWSPYQRAYPDHKRDGHKSYLYIDELGVATGGNIQPWIEKNTPFAFGALKAMVEHTSILNAVIGTRVRQIHPFLRPHSRHSEHPLGFEIRPKNKGLSDKLTKVEEKTAEHIQDFLLNCGDECDPRKRDWIKERSNLTTFMAKSIRDTLTMDACPIETEMTVNGKKLAGFYGIAGETVRLAHEEGYSGDDQIIAVQIFEDQVVTLYEPTDLIYPVRNPRTDIQASKYGYAETEQFVRVVTGFMNALTYNMAGFDRNNLPRGFLTMFGNFDAKQLNHFKRQWTAMLNGASRRWAFPVLTSQNKESGSVWTPIDSGFDEMHFAKWMSFLVSIICAVYSIAPEEINFDSFTSRNASSLGGEDTSEKLAASRDKGLEPLVTWYECLFNEYVIPLIHPDYQLRFVGLHPEDDEWMRAVKEKTSTYDEMRKLRGEDPWDDPKLGSAPMDPNLMPVYQMQLQQEQMENMSEEDQHGIPQEYIDRMKEPGQPGQPGGQPGQPGQNPPGQELQQNNPIITGKEKNNEAAQDIKRAAKAFVLHTNIDVDDDFQKPTRGDERREHWSW